MVGAIESATESPAKIGVESAKARAAEVKVRGRLSFTRQFYTEVVLYCNREVSFLKGLDCVLHSLNVLFFSLKIFDFL